MITNGTYPKAMLGINRELVLITCSESPTLVSMAVPVLHLRLKARRLGAVPEFFLSNVLFPIVCLNLDQPSFVAFRTQSNFAPYPWTSGMLDYR